VVLVSRQLEHIHSSLPAAIGPRPLLVVEVGAPEDDGCLDTSKVTATLKLLTCVGGG
jgi:hypothetical protein